MNKRTLAGLVLLFVVASGDVFGLGTRGPRAEAADIPPGGMGMERVSLALDGGEADRGSQGDTSLSADGRFVAFTSLAGNLVPGDNNYQEDAFVRDRLTGTTVRVSVASDGSEGNDVSGDVFISVDGRIATFSSQASNLVPGDTNGQRDVFMHELASGQTERISIASNGQQGDGWSLLASLSVDGQIIKFFSSAHSLTFGDHGEHTVFVYDRGDGSLTGVDAPWENGSVEYADFSALSWDGRYVAFISADRLVAADDNLLPDIYVRDTVTGTITYASVAADGSGADRDSHHASLSADGRFVVFDSQAGNLVSGDGNACSDVFVRDLVRGVTARVSGVKPGTEDIWFSDNPAISADGRLISFISYSPELVPDDLNGEPDVFVAENPLFGQEDAALAAPVELVQQSGADGGEIGVGRIANEGEETADTVRLSARVESADGQPGYLEVEVIELDEAGNRRAAETLRSDTAPSGARASVEYAPRGGLYAWRARSGDAAGRSSAWVEFGGNASAEADFISSNFSFVFLTDVHLGSNEAFGAFLAGKDWHESQSYSRFTDTLFEIERLTPKPDFILIGGDNVEYNDPRWLQDFKRLTDDYRTRTGIGVYYVPGNHDRYDSESGGWSWEDWNLSGGGDRLRNFSSVIGKPDWMTSLFMDDTAIMGATESGAGGLNRYNFSFNHKGFQFIGLDSGEDTGQWDLDPEGSGLSVQVLDRLETLTTDAPSMSRIIFMHHPVYAKLLDFGETLGSGTWIQNGAIASNWQRFVDDCLGGNVQLILSGHTHEGAVFNQIGRSVDLTAWAANTDYPLFLQTQSAGKGDDHGYRLIRVRNGRALPEEPAGVRPAQKMLIELDEDAGLNLSAFDGQGGKLSFGAGSETSSFLASASGRLISYDNLDGTRLEIKNEDPLQTSFNLRLERRGEGIEIVEEHQAVFGYRIENQHLCDFSQLLCPEFLLLRKGQGKVDLSFKDIEIQAGSTDSISVDWDNLQSGAGPVGLTLGFDGNRDTSFGALIHSFIVDLDSPGELRVMDAEGRVTGLVDGSVVEEIPYSSYDPNTETVFVFGNDRATVTEDFYTEVVGQYAAGYGLSLTLAETGQDVVAFEAEDISIDGETVHRFGVDWEILQQGGRGVVMEADENHDGVFESYGRVGAQLSAAEIAVEPRSQLRMILAELGRIQVLGLLSGPELGKAIDNLEEILLEKYWQDDSGLRMSQTKKFFLEKEKVEKSLRKIIESKKTSPADAHWVGSVLQELEDMEFPPAA